MKPLIPLILLVLLRLQTGELHAQNVFPDPDGWAGTLIVSGGGGTPDEVTSLMKQAATSQRPAVVLPDASENPREAGSSAERWLKECGVTEVVQCLAAEHQTTESLACLDNACIVWICGGQQDRLAAAWQGVPVEDSLRQVLERGDIVGGTSAGAAIMSKVMIAGGRDEPEIRVGWDLVADAIIDQHFSERNRIGRSRKAIAGHPDHFGLGIDEDTSVLISGRRMRVVGKGQGTILLPMCSYRDAETIVLSSGQEADLTQIRRAVRQRASGVDPGKPTAGNSEVANGSLVIVGGGSMPMAIVERFVDLAGGSDADIVVLPTAVPREQTDLSIPSFLKKAGVRSVTVLPQRGADVETPEFQSALAKATGIWFGGGRQWNFVDSYEGTNAVSLFHDLLKRGGVIGGSSAGATIQGEFLVRGHPLGNVMMMAEGYERGFSFLPGTAIDQHFSQRSRHADLVSVIQRHPKLLGIGLDEGTAVVVKKDTAEVVGEHAAYFLRSTQLPSGLGDDSQVISTEQTIDLYVKVLAGQTVHLQTLSVTNELP